MIQKTTIKSQRAHLSSSLSIDSPLDWPDTMILGDVSRCAIHTAPTVSRKRLRWAFAKPRRVRHEESGRTGLVRSSDATVVVVGESKGGPDQRHSHVDVFLSTSSNSSLVHG
jgi:hypothetical protein